MTLPYHPLQAYLDAAVPLYIAALIDQGGPDDTDIEAARAFGRDLAERGDVMLYGGKPGEASELADDCAKSIAILAFAPGGITVFGRHWEAGERPAGAYYTPRAVLDIIEPQAGSGAFLAELASNPPWGES